MFYPRPFFNLLWRPSNMGRYSGRPRGVIVYEGPSRIDGEPIVLIATFQTANEKTGNLIQTWILKQDQRPTEAINEGTDSSVCGDCPLRGFIDLSGDRPVNRDRGCYVVIDQAPTAVYDAYKRGSYPRYDKTAHARWFRGRGIRIGSYGDPVAVSLVVWKPILRLCRKCRPGYTHQWKKRKFQNWRFLIMASTHSEAELRTAESNGWRSYRTRTEDQPILPGEAICPATEEGGYQHTCESCGACDGANAKPHMVTVIHGGRSNLPAARRVVAAAQ